MGPLNRPTCHSSCKDYTVANMHRANYVGIPLGPEPLYAHYANACHLPKPCPPTSMLTQEKEKSNVSRPGSSRLHESIHMCSAHALVGRVSTNQALHLSLSLKDASRSSIKLGPLLCILSIRSQWGETPWQAHVNGCLWFSWMNLVKEWLHMTGTHTSTFRSSLTVFSITAECIWYVGRGIPSWSTSGTSFSKGINNTEFHTALHVRAHQETHHVSFPESTFHNAAQHYKQPYMHLTCFHISCSASRSACIPADAINRGNGLETAKVVSRGSGGGVSPPSHSWVFLIICEDQQCSRMHKGRDLTARSSG